MAFAFAKEEVILYPYAGNNPISFVDPLGLTDFSITGPMGIFGPGIGNLTDPAFDFAIVNTSLTILSSGGWAAFGGSGTALGGAALTNPAMSQSGGRGLSGLTPASEELLD